MRVLVVHNPRAGAGTGGLLGLLDGLGRAGAEVTFRYVPEAADLDALLADASTFDRVVAAGGDGTVSAITYALRGSRVPILAYHGGTANLIATNLGVPADGKRLTSLVLDGSHVDVDIGEVTYERASPGADEPLTRTLGFVMATGAGFDAKIIEGARDLKATLGPVAYLVAALQNLTPSIARFTLSLDGRKVETEGIAVLLANFAKIQFDITVTHQTDVRDGLMDVVVLATRNVPELLPALWAGLVDGFVSAPERPGVEFYKASAVEIYADPPLTLQADGEVLDGFSPMRARMLPGAARFIVPKDSPLAANDS